MHRYLFLIAALLLQLNSLFAQEKVNWKMLANVEHEVKYHEEEEVDYLHPTFSKSVQALEGKQIEITGFTLVLDEEAGYFILSQYPFASCFFCGGAGPETIIELKLKKPYPRVKMDEVRTLRGRLVLNYDDIYQCIYILQDIEFVD